ncbi:spore germination protein [Cohnella silvisoli]|uniref:Spore germination protein n=1 Tax=Cohnella silvisoli TaxID=2873699 RepID=A0ABV1KS37_9BACL|nr:spore germination protein [Cohnella silvisoli]MCD9024614.1 spore germination protein [Cohnella silvisoli]
MNHVQDTADEALSYQLKDNLHRIKQDSGNSSDIKCREVHIEISGAASVKGIVAYTDGLSDSQALLNSLMNGPFLFEADSGHSSSLLIYLKDHVITESGVTEIESITTLFDHLLSGDSILLLEGSNSALAIGTKNLKARQVEEPNVQAVVRGPREGFTEVLSWNTAMVRRKIKDRRLWIEKKTIGTVTKTEVAIAYIDGIVAKEILAEVRQRLELIEIDGVLESNYIEEHIQEKRFALFPTVFNSERPDVVAAQLLEGRIAIMVDGTPFVLIVPAVFTQFFQSSEDYYQASVFSSLIRLLRILAFILALVTPSFYIAVTTFHQELLPTTLLYNLASQREGVPFPAFVEALMMEVTFEILREASVRMPRTIGQSISIVGTLVIGQAAVEAGLVTAAMVIVVSITAIANFVMPAFNLGITVRIIRFLLMALAASFGLFGLFLGLIVIVVRLCSLHSFGVPYMSPLAPFRISDQKDTLFRLPLPMMKKRPVTIPKENNIRQRDR